MPIRDLLGDRCPVARWTLLVVLVVAAGATSGCQLFDDEPLSGDVDSATPGAGGAPVGAPDEGVPGDLSALVARTTPEATRWQPQPRPAEAVVELGDQRWRAASVTYAAAGAESVLVVRVDGGGVSTQRVNFQPLGLEPIPADAITDLPPLQGVGALDELVAAAEAQFPACDAEGPAVEVRLATGAPASWEGDAWAQPPRWRAVVSDGQGVGVRLDAERAEPVAEDRCVDTGAPSQE